MDVTFSASVTRTQLEDHDTALGVFLWLSLLSRQDNARSVVVF